MHRLLGFAVLLFYPLLVLCVLALIPLDLLERRRIYVDEIFFQLGAILHTGYYLLRHGRWYID